MNTYHKKFKYTMEDYFVGNTNDWCHLIRSEYSGRVICRVYIKDFQDTHDKYLLAYHAAKGILEDLNNAISN